MTAEEIAAGYAALQAGRWQDAKAAFGRALAAGETGAALEGMGDALWWLGEVGPSVEYRARAYAEFRRAGDPVSAAMTAAYLAICQEGNFGNRAAAGGWIARAERLLPDTDEVAVPRAWVWVIRAYVCTDPGLARRLTERALALARSAGDTDLELCALSGLGQALVAGGRAQEGLALIDEAMAGIVGGEHTRLDSAVFICCDMLTACDLVSDLERASQWCRVADALIRRYGCPFLYARCRIVYGRILVATGDWAEAERELTAAVTMSAGAGPAMRARARAYLADLRLRQGRLEEAEALLADSGEHPPVLLTAAAVRLARGEPAVTAALLERLLAPGPDPAGPDPAAPDPAAPDSAGSDPDGPPELLPALALLVQVRLAGGDHAAAATAATRVTALARRLSRPGPAAAAAVCAARVAAAAGRATEAAAELERALALLAELDLPFETARARLELARVLAASRPQVAVAEGRSALAVFERLGAVPDADAAAELLRSLGAPGRSGPRDGGMLTRREQEVLDLVSLGLTNPEIAARLCISRKTAAHHVSSLLTKLGLRNRAEVVAYAARRLGQPAVR